MPSRMTSVSSELDQYSLARETDTTDRCSPIGVVILNYTIKSFGFVHRAHGWRLNGSSPNVSFIGMHVSPRERCRSDRYTATSKPYLRRVPTGERTTSFKTKSLILFICPVKQSKSWPTVSQTFWLKVSRDWTTQPGKSCSSRCFRLRCGATPRIYLYCQSSPHRIFKSFKEQQPSSRTGIRS